jgi:hypothetical protein
MNTPLRFKFDTASPADVSRATKYTSEKSRCFRSDRISSTALAE